MPNATLLEVINNLTQAGRSFPWQAPKIAMRPFGYVFPFDVPLKPPKRGTPPKKKKQDGRKETLWVSLGIRYQYNMGSAILGNSSLGTRGKMGAARFFEAILILVRGHTGMSFFRPTDFDIDTCNLGNCHCGPFGFLPFEEGSYGRFSDFLRALPRGVPTFAGPHPLSVLTQDELTPSPKLNTLRTEAHQLWSNPIFFGQLQPRSRNMKDSKPKTNLC